MRDNHPEKFHITNVTDRILPRLTQNSSNIFQVLREDKHRNIDPKHDLIWQSPSSYAKKRTNHLFSF